MKKRLFFILLFTAFLSSCLQDNYENPPSNGVDPNMTANITIAQLKALYLGTAIQLDDSWL
jgi:PBP1b-binding outer membrane lipoprotein LpoB